MKRMIFNSAIIAAGLMTVINFCSCNLKKSPTTINPQAEKITVLPVNNIPDDFIMGVDVSSLVSVEAGRAKFYGANGMASDPIALLKAGGANAVRIRVWNNPNTNDGRTYGGGANDIEVACNLGKRATSLGMKVLIDFHYSDFWADPNKQTPPKGWEKFSLEEKQKAIAEYTTGSLAKLKKAGVKVSMVQVGNEINNGLCGEIYDAEVCSLVKAGAEAVRSFDKAIQIAVHYTDPLSEGYLEHKASLLEKYGVDYDVFGTSYYPYWHGDVKKLSVVLRKLSNFYNKKVMVMEVSYPFTDEDGDGFGNVVSTMSANQEFKYPLTVEGQAIAVRDVIDAVVKVKGAGIGVFYWEPAWIPPKHFDLSRNDAEKVLAYNQNCWAQNGSGWATFNARDYDKEVKSAVNGGTWDNQAFFDFDGKVLDSINVWNYARTGSKGDLKVVHIDDLRVEFAYGKQNELPSTAKVAYNDGSIVDEAVDWHRAQAETVLIHPDFGEYKVTGKTKKGDDVTCYVNVTASNLLVNGNFEKGTLEGWTITNDLGKGNPKVDKNNQNAKEGLCYATGWEPDNFDFTLSQELKGLDKGEYKCFASFEGTGIKNPSETCLVAEIKRKNGKIEVLKANATVPNQWKKFDRVEIPNVMVDDSVDTIVVKVRMAVEFAKDGANGAWLVCDDVNFLLVK